MNKNTRKHAGVKCNALVFCSPTEQVFKDHRRRRGKEGVSSVQNGGGRIKSVVKCNERNIQDLYIIKCINSGIIRIYIKFIDVNTYILYRPSSLSCNESTDLSKERL